jgi:glyoxylase-like metal-dependent hydrolase (beta-lactamase superfamily II)
MKRTLFPSVAICIAFTAFPALAQDLQVQNVTDGIWALVGKHEQRNPDNLANNATFGLIDTADGAVLIDPGGSWAGAKALHETIKGITDSPVKYVINTGGQDHRWLGNDYWQDNGAIVIASANAVADQNERASMQMTMLRALLKDTLDKTEPSAADQTFDTLHEFTLGGLDIEIHHPGAAHTPGDSFVWVPSKQTVFTGDIVYVERVLGLGSQSSISEWPTSFQAFAALNPTHIVPGHGRATTLEMATAQTYDYLMNLRAQIGALLDTDGTIIDAPKIDQSAFASLEQFDSLAGRNAQQAFEQMEWE